MSDQSFLDTAVFVKTLTCNTFTPPAGCITDAAIVAAAGVAYTKLQHKHQPAYSQATGSVSATERRVVHVVRGATGTVVSVRAGSRTVCAGAATIVVDLLKNGTTILSGTVTLNSSSTAYIVQAGTISSASLVAGDVLEISVTATAGGGTVGNGVFAVVELAEDAM